MYIVIELQTTGETTAIVPPVAFADLNQAYQKYYTVLSAAAVSTLPIHAAAIINETGAMVRSDVFEHPVETESTEPTE